MILSLFLVGPHMVKCLYRLNKIKPTFYSVDVVLRKFDLLKPLIELSSAERLAALPEEEATVIDSWIGGGAGESGPSTND